LFVNELQRRLGVLEHVTPNVVAFAGDEDRDAEALDGQAGRDRRILTRDGVNGRRLRDEEHTGVIELRERLTGQVRRVTAEHEHLAPDRRAGGRGSAG